MFTFPLILFLLYFYNLKYCISYYLNITGRNLNVNNMKYYLFGKVDKKI